MRPGRPAKKKENQKKLLDSRTLVATAKEAAVPRIAVTMTLRAVSSYLSLFYVALHRVDEVPIGQDEANQSEEVK